MLQLQDLDPRLLVRKDLVKNPVIVLVNEFDEKPAQEFRKAFNEAHETGQEVIPVLIDSFGGYIYSLFSMIETIKSSRLPVATIVSGKACSCGAVLLTAGKEGLRFCGPDSMVLIHQASSGFFGKNSDIQIKASETNRLNKKLMEIMAYNVGKNPDYFIDMVAKHKYGDIYLTPQQAKKHNIVNHVRIPTLKTKVSVEFSLI